jgi:hypothetical protein
MNIRFCGAGFRPPIKIKSLGDLILSVNSQSKKAPFAVSDKLERTYFWK